MRVEQRVKKKMRYTSLREREEMREGEVGYRRNVAMADKER